VKSEKFDCVYINHNKCNRLIQHQTFVAFEHKNNNLWANQIGVVTISELIHVTSILVEKNISYMLVIFVHTCSIMLAIIILYTIISFSEQNIPKLLHRIFNKNIYHLTHRNNLRVLNCCMSYSVIIVMVCLQGNIVINMTTRNMAECDL